MDDLQNKLTVVGKKELDIRLANKKIICEKLGIPFDGIIRPWDQGYYYNLPEVNIPYLTIFQNKT